MESYEDLILARQENDLSDDCSTCPYKGIDTCQNQCMMETVTIFSIEDGRYHAIYKKGK